MNDSEYSQKMAGKWKKLLYTQAQGSQKDLWFLNQDLPSSPWELSSFKGPWQLGLNAIFLKVSAIAVVDRTLFI